MEAVLILPLSPTFNFLYSPRDSDGSANIFEKSTNNSKTKLKIHFKVNQKIDDKNMRNEEAMVEEKQMPHGDREDKAEEEEEFSFDCTNSNVSMVLAEDVFVNGMIRPMFPVISEEFDDGSTLRPPLKKLYIQRPGIHHSWSVATKIEELNGTLEDPSCKWQSKLVMDTSLERCKKSNSTGFSKLWRFREVFRRSKSNGEDAFVFMNPPTSGVSKKEAKKVNIKTEKKMKLDEAKGTKVKTTSSVNEKYYLINRAKKENDKRRSYLPYKLGFFTSVNGMSRNVHHF